MPLSLSAARKRRVRCRSVKLMTAADLEACRVLGLSSRDDGVTRLVAKRIITAAKSGERDPERLVRCGLEERSFGS